MVSLAHLVFIILVLDVIYMPVGYLGGMTQQRSILTCFPRKHSRKPEYAPQVLYVCLNLCTQKKNLVSERNNIMETYLV